MKIEKTEKRPEEPKLPKVEIDSILRKSKGDALPLIPGRVSGLIGHKEAVRCVCFAPDGTVAASGCKDGLVKLWDIRTGEEIGTLPLQAHQVGSAAFTTDGKYLITSSFPQIDIDDLNAEKLAAIAAKAKLIDKMGLILEHFDFHSCGP